MGKFMRQSAWYKIRMCRRNLRTKSIANPSALFSRREDSPGIEETRRGFYMPVRRLFCDSEPGINTHSQ